MVVEVSTTFSRSTLWYTNIIVDFLFLGASISCHMSTNSGHVVTHFVALSALIILSHTDPQRLLSITPSPLMVAGGDTPRENEGSLVQFGAGLVCPAGEWASSLVT